MKIELTKYFTLEENVKRLERMPELKTPIMDLVFPQEKRADYSRSLVSLRDLPKEIKNIPVIMRGATAVPISEKNGFAGFEPFPVEAVMRLTASDLNDFVSMGIATQQSEIDRKVDRLRRTTRATTEALSAQSLTGKISYYVQGGAGYTGMYEADFGKTKTYTVAKKWDDTATLATFIKDCLAMTDLVSGNGFGNTVAVLVNATVFSAVIDLILSQEIKAFDLIVENNLVRFPGFTVHRIASTYYDYKTKQEVPVIPSKKSCVIALDAPHWLPYCAIDDFDANLAPLPFFSKAVKIENPSAWDIFGKSKPFPVPIVDAICWADVLK